jgi:hypothetical protein
MYPGRKGWYRDRCTLEGKAVTGTDVPWKERLLQEQMYPGRKGWYRDSLILGTEAVTPSDLP